MIYVPKFDNLYKKRYIGYILDMYASCKNDNILIQQMLFCSNSNIKVRGDDASKFLIMGAFLVLLFFISGIF